MTWLSTTALGRGQSQKLADQAALAEKLARAQQGDHRFPAIARRDHNLDSALEDIENGICRGRLLEDDSALAIRRDLPTVVYGGEKYLWIEGSLSPFGHCPQSLVIPADNALSPLAVPAGRGHSAAA
jgi:hypothetical protein